MKARTSADIKIYRNGTELISAPITTSSVRRCKLMEYDEVYIKFSALDSDIICRGDYIDDEVFGRFYSKEKQFPKFNKSTGGYDYEITFVRSQYLWDKYKCVLVTNLTSGNTYCRKEVSWKLTSTIYNHASQIRLNLLSAGLYQNVRVLIQGEIESRAEANLIEYSDIDIISALTLICDTYNCEWWTVESDDAKSIDLYFGKCEYWELSGNPVSTEYTGVYGYSRHAIFSQDVLQVSEGVNAERITPTRNTSDYFNKLFVFGGTTNVPSNYRKELNYKVNNVSAVTEEGNTYNVYKDTSKTISKDIVSTIGNLAGSTEGKFTESAINQTNVYAGSTLVYYEIKGTSFNLRRGVKRPIRIADDSSFKINIKKLSYLKNGAYIDLVDVYSTKFIYDVVYTIVKKSGSSETPTEIQRKSNCSTTEIGGTGTYGSELSFNIKLDKTFTERSFIPGEYYLEVSVYIKGIEGNGYYSNGNSREYIHINTNNQTIKIDSGSTLKCESDIYYHVRNEDYSPSYLSTIGFGDVQYYVLFNPNEVSSGAGYDSFYFVSIGSDGVITHIDEPSGFGNGSAYKMYIESSTIPYGLQYLETPFGHYSNEYDNSDSLYSLGENRLFLPIESGQRKNYLLADGVDEDNVHSIVEKSIIFDYIYPRCTLKVKAVEDINRSDSTTYEDGSVGKTSYKQYSVQLCYIDGSDFDFKSRYQQDGTVLGISFITDAELTEQEKEQTYNVSSLAGMKFDCSFDGSGNFVISRNDGYGTYLPNTVMCPKVGDILVLDNWDVRAMAGLGLIEKAEQELKSMGQEYLDSAQDENPTFEVVMMSDYIKSKWVNNLKGGMSGIGDLADVTTAETTTRSRILSFQYKLDFPWDSPEMAIGDTERYSRLKQIENGIYRLNHKKNGRKGYGELSVLVDGGNGNNWRNGYDRFRFVDVTADAMADLDVVSDIHVSDQFAASEDIIINPKFKKS